MKKIDQLKQTIEFYKIHTKLINTQKDCFKSQMENLKHTEGMLIMDFKENLKLGGCPREVSQDF